MTIRQPRVDDQRTDDSGERVRFTSKILPPYLRKTKSIEELIPWLYLKGISTGDFSEALAALLGTEAPGLSASTVVRLKEVWQRDYEAWSKRSLADKRYVYFWVDGIHFNVRLEEGRQCILVVMGATPAGKKELVAIQDGYRESEQSWKELLLDLKARGLEGDPKLAIGDGALGFWKAEADKAFDLFIEAKYPKATKCLAKDRDVLLTFYDFPARHWAHIRTTNPLESTFATVRLRTRRTKGRGSRIACLTMVFRLTQCAEQHWRALAGSLVLDDVIRGVQFKDGLRKDAA